MARLLTVVRLHGHTRALGAAGVVLKRSVGASAECDEGSLMGNGFSMDGDGLDSLDGPSAPRPATLAVDAVFNSFMSW
jgi:hypothetical protein